MKLEQLQLVARAQQPLNDEGRAWVDPVAAFLVESGNQIQVILQRGGMAGFLAGRIISWRGVRYVFCSCLSRFYEGCGYF